MSHCFAARVWVIIKKKCWRALQIGSFVLVGIMCGVEVRAQVSQSALGDGTAPRRFLIIEAQDLGMAHSINKATFEALENHWVTSAAVLTPAPWFPEVVTWARLHAEADIGIAVDLNAEWQTFRWRSISPQSPASGLADGAGYLPRDARQILQQHDQIELKNEIKAQVELMRTASIAPTHLGCHGTIMDKAPWLLSSFWEEAQREDLSLAVSKRFIQRRGVRDDETHYKVGDSKLDIRKIKIDEVVRLTQRVDDKDWLTAYEQLLSGLSPGVYQLVVHLGFDNEELQAMMSGHSDWGAHWRQNDYDVIRSPEFHEFLKKERFILIGWNNLEKLTTRQ